MPLDLKCRESYVLHNEELIDASKKLAEEIIGIKIDPVSNTLIEEPKSDMTEQDPLKTYVRLSAESFIGAEIPVHFDVDADRRLIREWLGINVDDAFFDCGGLKRKVQLIGGAETLIGTDEEKLKYKKLTELSDQLTQLETRSLYLSAFNRLDYLPLAIQNISDVEDQSIRIVVHVVEGEIVNPSRDLICEELEDNQGFLCRDEDENSGVGIIDELFILPEDGNVHVEEQPFEYSPDLPKIPTLVNGRLQYPGKDEKDYENELQEYIAWSSNGNYYEFEVKSLRPNECKWLSYGMLIKPTEEGIKLTYQIHSSRSGGDLSGELEWRKQN